MNKVKKIKFLCFFITYFINERNKKNIFIKNMSISESVAQIKQQPPWVSIGNYLRADKTGSKVHLDWALYGGSENFRIYRSINNFTFSNPSVIQELTAKIYDDDVLYDGNNYAYKIYKNVPTEAIYYYHTDHLMTPLYLTDESQSIVWQAEYYPFGRIYSQTGEVSNNLRFPGQYAEEILNNSSLYYNWHRWYGAKQGRYYEVDPYIRKIYRNVFSYSNLNPTTKYDFNGLFTIDPSCKCKPYDAEKAAKDACTKYLPELIQKKPQWKTCIKNACNNMKIKCNGCSEQGAFAESWYVPKRSLCPGKYCEIVLCKNFKDLAPNFQACKIIHEIAHLCGANEKEATDLEMDMSCFGEQITVTP